MSLRGDTYNMGKRVRVRKLTKKEWIIAGAAALVIIALLVTVGAVKKSRQASAIAQNGTHIVERGNVSLTITGSAAVEPYERYEIIAKASGDIIEAPFEVGDYVEEGQTVYQFDASETDISMQKQRISLDSSKTSYENALKDADKLYITAKASGIISDFDLEVGDDVKAGQKACTINNTVLMKVTVPFSDAQAKMISVGDRATVSSSVHMTNISGTVTHKEANSRATQSGAKIVNVTISFENPGALTSGMTVGAAVGDMISSGSGVIEESDMGEALCEAEGTVTNIYHTNGDYVKKGEAIARISSDTITNSIKNSKNNYDSAKLNMQDAEKKLEDYNLTSPISGTVITKNAKAGDTIEMGNSANTLMVIADISKLKFSLEIDELDVNKVKVGQAVEVTCDAIPEDIFLGEITNVSVEGTSLNGVTTYTAEVVINEPGSLRPSMNIDASVVLESAQNTLIIPSEDVKTTGNMSYVFRKIDKNKKDDAEEKSNERPNLSEEIEKGEMPERPEGMEMPKRAESARDGRLPEAPDGFETVIVTVGVVGDEYTEILSGLSEGDEVYKQSLAQEGSDLMRMMGMMGGMPSSSERGNMPERPGGMGR